MTREEPRRWLLVARAWLQLVPLLRYQAADARQSMGALLVATFTNVISGLTLGFMSGTLDRLPGLIVLVPAAIGMRGNIFGALGSRLGTAIHTGEFQDPLSKRSVAGQGILASAFLTLFVSVALAFLAKEISRLFGVETMSLLDFLTISLLGGILSSIVVLLITVRVAVVSVRRGWDMDNVAAPVVTVAGDVVTLPALWLSTLLLPIPGLREILALASAVATAVAVLYMVRLKSLVLFRSIVRQSLPVLMIAGSVDIVAGITIDRRLDHFLEFPALLVLIPPFLADAGALGGILSARLASKLHLGQMAPTPLPGAAGRVDIFLVSTLAVPLFLLVGITSTIAAHFTGLAHPGFAAMAGVALLAGVIATAATVFVAYYASVVSYRFGLDPDNYGIPSVTSSMDMIGAVAIVIALVLMGHVQ